MKDLIVLLLQIAGVALIAAAGFIVSPALGCLVLGAGLLAFSLAWERDS